MSNPTTKPTYSLPPNAVWFITGCSSGIGRALALHVASATNPSHRLVATARDPSTLSYLPSSPNVLALQLDVTSPSSVSAAIAATLERFSRIDVLVNNAGYMLSGDTESASIFPSPPREAASSCSSSSSSSSSTTTTTTSAPAVSSSSSTFSPNSPRALFETNFWSVVHLTQQAIRIMRDVNPAAVSGASGASGSSAGGQRGGLILNVSSMGGRFTVPGSAFYHASKFALEGFTESVSKETRPEWNVHFSTIEPGGVKTGFVNRGWKRIEPAHEAYRKEDTPARVLERYVNDPKNQETWSDAGKIAERIYEVVVGSSRNGDGTIPMRVVLGEDAWAVLMMENERQRVELEEGRERAVLGPVGTDGGGDGGDGERNAQKVISAVM